MGCDPTLATGGAGGDEPSQKPATAGARCVLAIGVPVVHPIEPAGVGPVGAGKELDRVDVVVVEVVVPDRRSHVIGGAVVDEVAGRGKDGGVGIHDVAAIAVVLPGGGQELHGAHGFRRGRPVDASAVALDGG